FMRFVTLPWTPQKVKGSLYTQVVFLPFLFHSTSLVGKMTSSQEKSLAITRWLRPPGYQEQICHAQMDLVWGGGSGAVRRVSHLECRGQKSAFMVRQRHTCDRRDARPR